MARNRLCDARRSFRIGKRTRRRNAPRIRSTGKKGAKMYRTRAFFFLFPAQKDPIPYIISRAIKIIYLQPSDLFLPLSFRPLFPPHSVKDGILVRTTHQVPSASLSISPLPSLFRSPTSYPLDKFRSGPLGATNKTVKPFN